MVKSVSWKCSGEKKNTFKYLKSGPKNQGRVKGLVMIKSCSDLVYYLKWASHKYICALRIVVSLYIWCGSELFGCWFQEVLLPLLVWSLDRVPAGHSLWSVPVFSCRRSLSSLPSWLTPHGWHKPESKSFKMVFQINHESIFTTVKLWKWKQLSCSWACMTGVTTHNTVLLKLLLKFDTFKHV